MRPAKRTAAAHRSTAWATAALALALSIGVALPCNGDGEVWRRHVPAPPAVGPAKQVVKAQDVAALLKDMPARRRRQHAVAPRVEARVLGLDGVGVSGVEVRVGVRVGKKSKKPLRLVGATDGEGRFALVPEGGWPAARLALDFAWDGGAKVVGVDLEPTRDGAWRIAGSHYKEVGSGEDAGNCRNLFRLETAGEAEGKAVHALTFAQPDSLLECEDVEYGTHRKSTELARLDDIGHRDLNRGDKNLFSRSDERAMGLEAAAGLDRELPLLRDETILRYVEGIARAVVAASDDPAQSIRVRVVHEDDANAFVTPGGNVYVFTGLLAAAQDESQLAGVLAHEVSHAVARHGTEGATRQIKTQVGTIVGSLAVGSLLGLEANEQEALAGASLFTAGLVGMRYDRRAETEADLLGSQYLWKAGWDPEAIARFFEVLQGKGGGAPPGWLSTHPSHGKRIENGLHWARAFLPARERYLVDTPAFQEARRRVKALPPAPKRQRQSEARGFAETLGRTDAFVAVVGRELSGVLRQAHGGAPAR